MTRSSYSAITLFLFDVWVALGSVFLAKYLQRVLPGVSLPDDMLWFKAGIYATAGILCFYFQDLYNWKYWRKTSELVSSLLLGGGLTLIALALCYYIVPAVGLERDVLLGSLIITLMAAFAFRQTSMKLKFGNHGSNLPVMDLATHKVEITAQNHGFSVDIASLAGTCELAHENLNDMTVEGMRCSAHPIFSVQHHPEASPGPHDSQYLFGRFVEMMEAYRKA